MGRELRRVPADWQHPRDDNGHLIPQYDETYEEALATWEEKYSEYPEEKPQPGETCYRQAFTSEPTHYQVYEDVSEGSPISPVFATVDEVVAWLIGKGYSEAAAQAFCEHGWAPSFMFIPGTGIIRDIETCGR